MSARRWLELEVYRALFASAAEEMGVLLQRSSSSPNIKERRDFSCALFTARGELFAQAAHIPVHLGSAPLSVRAALAAHRFRPGDAVVLNDPYQGGTHLPDITLVSPVFLGAERPAFFVANRAHHADVGGYSPGSMASCPDIFGEGLRIPPVPLVREGVMDQALLALILANVRTAAERRADLEAQIAANRRGIQRLEELGARHGVKTLQRAGEDLLVHAERRTRAFLEELPDGTWSFEDVLDDDGAGHADVPIRVTITVRGPEARFDFTGTAPQVAGSMNANPAVVLSAVLYVFQALMGDLAPNEGMARPLDLHLPEGSLLAPAEGAAVAGGNVETSQRVVDVLLGALAQVLPDRVPAASQGTMNNLTIGVARGAHSFSYYETTGGGAGAGPAGPGASGIQTHMTNTWNTPIEALETAYPLRVVQTRLARGTGGAGRHPGGDGILREVELRQDARVSILSERRTRGPYGLQGGSPGRPGCNWVVRQGRRQARPAKFAEDLSAGDRIGMRTPGGGGFGKARKGKS